MPPVWMPFVGYATSSSYLAAAPLIVGAKSIVERSTRALTDGNGDFVVTLRAGLYCVAIDGTAAFQVQISDDAGRLLADRCRGQRCLPATAALRAMMLREHMIPSGNGSCKGARRCSARASAPGSVGLTWPEDQLGSKAWNLVMAARLSAPWANCVSVRRLLGP